MLPNEAAAAIYVGTVVHHRLRPHPHHLSYGVFSLLVDIDRIDEAFKNCRLISYNRFNLFSVYDRDHGPGDGTPLREHARQLLADAKIDIGAQGRIHMLAYPRMCGSVFNPLSVYYGSDRTGRLLGAIYEVNNTFAERRAYVVRAGDPHGAVYAQRCDKELYVSPFITSAGRYGFRLTIPGQDLLLGVQFYDASGPLIRTHFRGTAQPLTDQILRSLLWRFPLLTLKVLGGIHYEALKLWLKGIPLVQRHRSPRYAVTIVPAESQ
jgi:uncharacterized protein